METVVHCLTNGGKHAEPSHLKLLMECANICNISANFLILGSEHHAQTCGVCADICEHCAEACERLAVSEDDAPMKACAEICHKCAESCQQMSGEKAKVA